MACKHFELKLECSDVKPYNACMQQIWIKHGILSDGSLSVISHVNGCYQSHFYLVDVGLEICFKLL